MIYYQNDKCILHHGDVIDCLRELEAESVQCVVTSPPFWNLRDYGVEGQMGLESSVGEYIEKLVSVFAEVKRVLRKDGICFCEIGDSYASGKGTCFNPGGGEESIETRSGKKDAGTYPLDRGSTLTLRRDNLKPKDLCLVPFRLALALQADGWWVRSDIIWAKPNPMPESVTDRPTSSHEHVFLLAKSANYYYDADAVTQKVLNSSGGKFGGTKKDAAGSVRGDTGNPRADNYTSRNLRTVWTIPTESFSGSHYATYPQKLVQPCVLAGTSERGACAKCGAPWERLMERSVENDKGDKRAQPKSTLSGGYMATGKVLRQQRDWRPTCECNCPDTVPCVVLDCYSGGGTTGLVALKLGRHYIGIDLNKDYLEMSLRRMDAALAQETLQIE